VIVFAFSASLASLFFSKSSNNACVICVCRGYSYGLHKKWSESKEKDGWLATVEASLSSFGSDPTRRGRKPKKGSRALITWNSAACTA